MFPELCLVLYWRLIAVNCKDLRIILGTRSWQSPVDLSRVDSTCWCLVILSKHVNTKFVSWHVRLLQTSKYRIRSTMFKIQCVRFCDCKLVECLTTSGRFRLIPTWFSSGTFFCRFSCNKDCGAVYCWRQLAAHSRSESRRCFSTYFLAIRALSPSSFYCLPPFGMACCNCSRYV